jgi:hypothetical protein
MKGKKTNLRERQIASIEYLKLNFPDHVHLIPEFLREQKIHQESDLWLQYTAAGLARLFEGYLEPAKSLLDPAGSESLKDSMQLAVIQKHLAHLQTQLQSKPDIKVMQRILESEVIAQLMQLNGKWTRNLIHCDLLRFSRFAEHTLSLKGNWCLVADINLVCFGFLPRVISTFDPRRIAFFVESSGE